MNATRGVMVNRSDQGEPKSELAPGAGRWKRLNVKIVNRIATRSAGREALAEGRARSRVAEARAPTSPSKIL